MSFYSDESVSFKRISDGTIRPVCKNTLKKGSVVFYELPVKSTGVFQIDILRYTMQCVYSGQVLFPCIFNKKESDDSTKFKVFFDYAFKTNFRRSISEKLATSLLEQNTYPYIFKAVGIFEVSETFNCQRVSLSKGDTFMVTTKDLLPGDVLISSKVIEVPSIDDTSSQVIESMEKIDLDRIKEFNLALGYRELARKFRPDGDIENVTQTMDPGLERRLEKYRLDHEMGITSFNESYIDMSTNMSSTSDDVESLEKMYNDLCETHKF